MDPEWRLLMVAGMWFQDLFNFDFDVIGMDPARVGTVEGEISFCAHNSAGWRQVLEHVHTDGFARGMAQNARPTSDLREWNRRAATSGGRETRSRRPPNGWKPACRRAASWTTRPVELFPRHALRIS